MTVDEPRAFALVLALARRASGGRPVVGEVGASLASDGALALGGDTAWVMTSPRAERRWSRTPNVTLTDDAVRVFDLFMPIVVGEGSAALVVGHIAQTIDGRIAVPSGESKFISAREDQLHTHRLRALFDVVLVGRHTVRTDDPLLTTRLCSGPSPVRVIIDPARRLSSEHRVFQDDGPETLLFCAAGQARHGERHGSAEVVPIDGAGGKLAPAAVVAALRKRGLSRIFVEGGGVTLSHFIEDRALARLHVAIAPLLLGAGVPSLTLPAVPVISAAIPVDLRAFTLGPDLLLDCAFRD